MPGTNGQHDPPDLARAVTLLAEVTAQTERITDAPASFGEGWSWTPPTTVVVSDAATGVPDDLPVENLAAQSENVVNDRDAVDAQWYARPWRERVQAADVAIAGMVLVIGLVGGLVFWLTSPSTAPGSKALGFPQVSTPSQTNTTSPTHSAATNPKTGASSGASTGTQGSPPASGSAAQSAGAASPSAPAASHSSSGSTGHATTTATPPQCTPSDLMASTITDSSEYSVGSNVTITTTIVAKATCVFAPVPSGVYNCPTTVVVVNQVGAPVYPQPGQGEQCAVVPGGTLSAGTGRTVTVVWDQAPLGQYTAVGTWSFGENSNPYEMSASSPPFTVDLGGPGPE